VKASVLEYSMVLLSALIFPDFNSMETLKTSRKVIDSVESAFAILEKESNRPNFLNNSDYMKRVKSAFNKRHSIAHGLMMRDPDLGIRSFHPQAETYVEIDDESLMTIRKILCALEAETLEVRDWIWDNYDHGGLIQLTEEVVTDTNPPKGTRLA